MNTVTLYKGSSEEKTIDIEEIQIPDLWHIAMLFRDAQRGYERQQKIADEQRLDKEWPSNLNDVTITIKGSQAKRCADAVLETWHLCHQFKKILAEQK